MKGHPKIVVSISDWRGSAGEPLIGLLSPDLLSVAEAIVVRNVCGKGGAGGKWIGHVANLWGRRGVVDPRRAHEAVYYTQLGRSAVM